jgi:hypothetical protein
MAISNRSRGDPRVAPFMALLETTRVNSAIPTIIHGIVAGNPTHAEHSGRRLS